MKPTSLLHLHTGIDRREVGNGAILPAINLPDFSVYIHTRALRNIYSKAVVMTFLHFFFINELSLQYPP